MKTGFLPPTRVLAAALWLATAAGCGGGGGGGNPPPPSGVLNIAIGQLPCGLIGVAYNQTITVTGGTGARNFSITAGALPSGLALTAATGAVTGMPVAPAGTSNFTVRVTDSGTPQQSDTQALSVAINAVTIARNDSIATATPLCNGSFNASISPSGHPNTVFDPDEDFYRITTTAASTVTIDIDAQINGSPLDPVIEFLAQNGAQLNTCVSLAFNSPCFHDDEVAGVTRDSLLTIRVNGATTFFVRVLDWRGDARPDLFYTIIVSGVN